MSADVEITIDAPAQITIDVNAGGGPPGPPGPPGPAGPPGEAYLNAQWGFNQNTVGPPASGTMRMDATTYAAATTLWVHETDRDGLDRQVGLDRIAVDDQIIMQSSQGRAVWEVTAVVDAGTYRTLTVTLVEATGNRPSGGSPTTLYFSAAGIVLIPIPPGGLAGQVLTKVSNADYDMAWL